ncbi:Short transient receptor putative channel 6 [Bulinus truncatus]|nr:Short transient receptor putative channel 6 [Bulinus truncatus]
MSFARIAYILPASETFGQLQISYGRMLQDVGKFIFIYFTVMIAFICGLTSLYSISKNENFAGLLETTGTLFWAAFGMGNSQAPAIKEDKVDNENNSSQGGATSEITDSELLKVIEMVGYILYGVYILGAVVVLINMLIAMMSNTFEDIQKSEDCEWKFARAKLWISFIEQGTTLPIPFNIIPTPKSIVKVFRGFKDCICCQSSRTEFNKEDSKQYEMDYKAIMHRVVLRYIHKMKFEKKGESLKDEILDTREEVIYQLHSMYGRLAARLELLEKDVFLLTKHGWDMAGSPNHSSLSHSRSVPSHPGNDGPKHPASDTQRDPFLYRRRSYYHERPKRANEGGGRVSLEERIRKYSETDPRSFRTSLGNLSSYPDDQTNMSDGDKRNRNANNPLLGSTTSIHHTSMNPATSTNGNNPNSVANKSGETARKESVISNVSQGVLDSDDFCLGRKDSFRMWSQTADTAFTPRTGRDRLSRDENIRGSRKGYNSSPRWNQGVIKESSLEDQINSSTEQQETSLSTKPEPYPASTVARREMFSYPNIDAPFGPPSGESCRATDFQEYHEAKPKRKDAIESLVLDVHQMPYTKLDLGSPGHQEGVNSIEGRRSSGQSSSSPMSADAVMASKKFVFPLYSNRAPSVGGICTATGSNVPSATPASVTMKPAHGGEGQSVTSGHNSDNEDQYAAKVSSVSYQQLYPRYQGKAIGSNAVPNSSPAVPKISDASQAASSEPELIKPALRLFRKLGHVNHVYVPDRLTQDERQELASRAQSQPNASNGESQIFYTRVPLETKSLLSDGMVAGNRDAVQPSAESEKRQEATSRSTSSTYLLPQVVCTDKDAMMFSQQPRPDQRLAGSSLSQLPARNDHNEQQGANNQSDLQSESVAVAPEPPPYSNFGREAPVKRDSVSAPGSQKHHRFLHTAREPRSRTPVSIPGLHQDYFPPSSIPWYPHYPFTMDPELISGEGPPPDYSPMVIPSLATNLQPFPFPTQTNDGFAQRPYNSSTAPADSSASGNSASGVINSINSNISPNTGVSNDATPKRKPSSGKKPSLVSLVRGRRSDKVKGKMGEVKHNRSVSLNRASAGSRRERLKTFQTQRSKEV